MTIKYLGHSSFLIKGRSGKLVTDPYGDSSGLKFPKVEADIVTISHGHSDHNNAKAVGGTPLVIDYPGEYEKSGIGIAGFKTFHDKKQGQERGDNVIYKIGVEGLTVLHLGDLGEILVDNLVDELGEVDVLLIPVGGFYTIDANEAVKVINKIEPSVVIPMHYNTSLHNQEIFKEVKGADEFIRTFGKEPERVEGELTVKKEGLEGELRVVLMEPTS